jgi:hypothetical protein
MSKAYTVDAKIKLKVVARNFKDGETIQGHLKLLDKDQNELAKKEFVTTVENYKAKYPFIIKDLANELGVKVEDVAYAKGWMDSDGDRIIDYSEEVLLEIQKEKKTLYFIFYDTNSKHLPKLESSAKKVYKEVAQDIETKQDKQNHILYLQTINSSQDMIDFVQTKVEQNGFKEDVVIGSLEAIREIEERTSIFEKVKDALTPNPNNELLNPQPHFQNKIDAQTINRHNENILRNERLHKHLKSKEHQKYVMMDVAGDFEKTSDRLGLYGAISLTLARVAPFTAPVTVPAGKGLTLLSEGAMYGKHLFKYFADEFKKEEFAVDLVLAKTIYCNKNELAEYAYDKGFTEMAKYLYEDE